MANKNATAWLGSRFPSDNQAPVIANQANYQTAADLVKNQIANAQTKRIYKKFIWRTGKLFWQNSGVGANNPASINLWNKTSRRTSKEEFLAMNCWESVLYMAYQCDVMSKGKIRNWENGVGTADQKMRGLFGTATAYNGHNANPGDILTFVNAGKGEIDHVAIYAGNLLGQQVLIHNLAWNVSATGIHGGGCIHFETVANTVAAYQGYNTTATVYVNQPFWEAGAPTFNYFTQL